MVVVEDEEEELGLALLVMTHWLVIAVGCVAIWPATVPKMCRHREVAFLALSAVNLLNPCKKAQEDEDEEVVQYASVDSMSCMTKRETSILLMMLANSMCHWKLYRLWTSLLRRKNHKIQKTKQDLCQCGLCWCHAVFNWHKFAKNKEKEKCGGNV